MFSPLSYFQIIYKDANNSLIVVIALPLAVPEPVALYPLNERYKAEEKENRQPKGILGDVAITNGPYNEPGGAYMFYGIVSSYIEFPNRGGLDTRFSITLMCWVQPGGKDGPLFSYGRDSSGVEIWIEKGRFKLINIRNNVQAHSLMSTDALLAGAWTRVAAIYDYDTGLNSLYINGHLSNSKNIGKGYEISTNAEEVRMGAKDYDGRYFKGMITEMKVYDVALNEAQIKQIINQGIANIESHFLTLVFYHYTVIDSYLFPTYNRSYNIKDGDLININ